MTAMNEEKRPAAVTETAVVRAGQAMRQQEDVKEIDLVEVALLLLDNLHYIVLFFLIGAVLFNAYAYFFIHPTYESTASIYVVSASGGTVVDLTDLNLGSSLKNDYKELIMSYPVLDRVSAKLDLDWSTDKMKSAISVVNPADTRIIKLTATAETPQLATDIANALATVVVEYLPETMSTEAPNIAQKARLPRTRANPSYTRYTAIGGILGALVCCAWFIARHLMDDTIRSAEDMEKYFGFAPLTVIPYVSAFEQDEHHRHKRRRSGKHNDKKRAA